MSYAEYDINDKSRRMTLADLLRTGKTPDDINAFLSGSTIGSGSLDPNFMAGEPYMPPQEQPMNSIVNARTGRAIPLVDAYGRPSQSQGQSQALDYSSAPVEFGGMKGYRVKGDPMSIVMADGRIVRMGADTGADRKRMMDDLTVQKARQDLVGGNIGNQIKLAELQNGKKATVPSGYRMTATGDLEPIPGGPADFKREGAFNADVASMSATESALNRLAEEANALKAAPGLGGITGIRGVLPDIPGTDAANARAKLDTLKSQVAFGTLQAMRDASKTGGALGAVSEKELKLLESNLAAIGTAQSKEEFEKALSQIVKYTDEAKSRSRSAFNMKHQSGTGGAPKGAAVPVRSEEDAMRLPPGTKFILNGRTGVRE